MGLIKPLLMGRRGPVRTLSRHKILHQLAEDILGPVNPARIRLLTPRSAFVLGIQTEQFFDADGHELWGKPANRKTVNRVLKNLSFAEVFLDLSASNWPWHEAQGLPQLTLDKLRFGPPYFPGHKTPLARTT